MDGVEISGKKYKKIGADDPTDLQQTTRVPNWKPGQWVFPQNTKKMKKISSISTHINEGDCGPCIWYANFWGGTRCPVKDIEREATPEEIKRYLSSIQ